MTPQTLRIIFAIVLFVHAIGHIQGIISSLGLVKMDSWNIRSAIMDNLLGEKGSQIFAIILFAVCTIGFLITAFSYLGIGVSHESWRTLAVIFSIPSLLSLVLYWNAFAMIFNKMGAIGVNLWILIGLLIVNFPTEEQIGL